MLIQRYGGVEVFRNIVSHQMRRLRSKKNTMIQTNCEPYSIFFVEGLINILREKAISRRKWRSRRSREITLTGRASTFSLLQPSIYRSRASRKRLSFHRRFFPLGWLCVGLQARLRCQQTFGYHRDRLICRMRHRFDQARNW